MAASRNNFNSWIPVGISYIGLSLLINQMQKLLIQFKAVAFIFLFSNSGASAHNPPSDRIPLYEHMLEINAEWQHHRSAIPNDIMVEFIYDIDRISTHLKLVVEELRNNAPNGLSSTALVNRMRLLDSLDYYANRKVFPTNTYHSQRTPYFIDNYGVHCAVGYLIAKSGHQDLANQISQDNRLCLLFACHNNELF